MNKGFLIATLVVFALLTIVFYFLGQQTQGYDITAFYVGNVLMALLALASYSLVSKNLKSNPQAFVRGVYSSTYLKLFVCVVSILIYIMVKRPNVHKPSIFVLLGIYAAYTIVETLFVSKLARKTK